MVIMDNFIVAGTQLKIERPGKAAGMAPVDSIEGPTVRLYNGDVLRIDDEKTAIELHSQVETIIDIGEILINYGDFLENNHPLIPASYCVEWWAQEYLKKTGQHAPENPNQHEVMDICNNYNLPLHPNYICTWHDIDRDEFVKLAEFIAQYGIKKDRGNKLLLPEEKTKEQGIKTILEKLLVLHRVCDEKITIENPLPFIQCLGLGEDLKKQWEELPCEDVLECVNKLSGWTVREKAPMRIGARMGRPEKANRRKMSPAPHVLFPIGESGGNTRMLSNAASYKANNNSKVGEINIEIGNRICPSCGMETHEFRCECGTHTIPKLFCPRCGRAVNKDICPKCKATTSCVTAHNINFKTIYDRAFERLGERNKLESFKGVKRMMSKHMTPEPLEKGILRAKHDLFTFKDGTVRYDMSDLPLTHIRADELGTTAEKLRELGYETDIHGNRLERDDQIVTLKVQDLVVSRGAAEYILQTTKYIDDLLVKYYGLEPHYKAETIEDIIGVMLIGLAPHTSAGVLGRLVGFTKASVGYAHPFFHAAKRRNCDGDEDCVMLLMDGLINFSHEYLPDKRGGKMDAPLVLTTRIDPSEVDKEAHNIDVCSSYPLEFYENTLNYTNPKELEDTIDLVSSRLGTQAQYDGFMFTHDTSDIAGGPVKSAYKTLGSMVEKMDAQLSLAEKIRAVDVADVAERVLISHFLPDLFGNLRAFSRQGTRCVKCGGKFRRAPLTGTCPHCGGRVILTVHEGAVKKYLEVSLKVAKKYNVSSYTQQRIELIGYDIESLFKNDKSKQMGLADYM
jgi:DNA polymerase II large subunit